MKKTRVAAIVAAATMSTFGMAAPAFAGTPAAVQSADGQSTTTAAWERIGLFPTVRECITAATAYEIATCTPENGGWVLYAFL